MSNIDPYAFSGYALTRDRIKYVRDLASRDITLNAENTKFLLAFLDRQEEKIKELRAKVRAHQQYIKTLEVPQTAKRLVARNKQ